ncbi:MAG: hypothetical protein JWM58_2457 [Rhizobium sp.]|nr:hypothetical protein [Rhizobium sp.]
MERNLLCYAYGHGSTWEAICIDFDLAIQGHSVREVQDGLDQMIKSFVADAHNEDSATSVRLLGRRAPLMVRVGFAYRLLKNLIINRGGKNGDHYAGYDVPCRA